MTGSASLCKLTKNKSIALNFFCCIHLENMYISTMIRGEICIYRPCKMETKPILQNIPCSSNIISTLVARRHTPSHTGTQIDCRCSFLGSLLIILYGVETTYPCPMLPRQCLLRVSVRWRPWMRAPLVVQYLKHKMVTVTTRRNYQTFHLYDTVAIIITSAPPALIV